MDDKEREQKLNELHTMAKDLRSNSAGGFTDLRRMGAMISGGYDFADTLHNIYLDYGYPATLTFNNFWNMYRRFGVATNVINTPVDIGWMSKPTVLASDSFLADIDKMVNGKIKLWSRLIGLDKRQRVGRYAGLYMRIRDGKQPSEPISGTLPSLNALLDVTPLYESQLQVIESDMDPQSDTFGQPKILQYRQSAAGDRNEETNNTINIHASRIIFVAEGADDGWIYGIPALEPIYNSLMDLRKIIGGGGEGFYKNAAQSIVFDLKDPASASANASKLDAFNEEYDEFARNRHRRAMWTPGMESNTLSSNLTSPEHFFNIALNDVAAGSGIPASILIGKQTGRLASDEDGKQFLSNIQSRRENFMTDMIKQVFDWMIKYGLLASEAYEIEWDDLLARSDAEKLDNADKMASINEKQFKSGQTVAFTEDEIRDAGGYEAMAEDGVGEEPGDGEAIPPLDEEEDDGENT